jgi:hypothetical protein
MIRAFLSCRIVCFVDFLLLIRLDPSVRHRSPSATLFTYLMPELDSLSYQTICGTI